ncbi:hypothetical protein, variant [Salpingoeca rosetta]|nr:hypothetical protein, variant [Salpingoeca rosetta]EGD76068.1 hypothetical protein, variant [Salpingoeca rosetta]|eukprot:XP_004998243.1 hypothetical protein, variant [Salpingoeca rosetta]
MASEPYSAAEVLAANTMLHLFSPGKPAVPMSKPLHKQAVALLTSGNATPPTTAAPSAQQDGATSGSNRRSRRPSILTHTHAPTLSDEDDNADDVWHGAEADDDNDIDELSESGRALMQTLLDRVRSGSPSSNPITCARCRTGQVDDDWLVEFCSASCHHEFMDREEELLFNSMNPAMQYPANKAHELNGFPVAAKNDVDRVAAPTYPLKLYMPKYRPGSVLVCKAGADGRSTTACYTHMVLLDSHCQPLYIVSPLIARKPFKAMLGLTDEGSDTEERARPAVADIDTDLGLSTKRAKRAIAAARARAHAHASDIDSTSDMELDQDEAEDAQPSSSDAAKSPPLSPHQQRRTAAAPPTATAATTATTATAPASSSPRKQMKHKHKKHRPAASKAGSHSNGPSATASPQAQPSSLAVPSSSAAAGVSMSMAQPMAMHPAAMQHQHQQHPLSVATSAGAQLNPYHMNRMYQQDYMRRAWANQQNPAQGQHTPTHTPPQQPQQPQQPFGPYAGGLSPFIGPSHPAQASMLRAHPLHFSQQASMFPQHQHQHPHAHHPFFGMNPATSATAAAGVNASHASMYLSGGGGMTVPAGAETETDEALSAEADDVEDEASHAADAQQPARRRKRRHRRRHHHRHKEEPLVQGDETEDVDDDAATEVTTATQEDEVDAEDDDALSAADTDELERQRTTNAPKWLAYYNKLGIHVPRLKSREAPTGDHERIYYLADKPHTSKAAAKRPKVDNSMTADAFMNRFHIPGTSNEYDLDRMFDAYQRACPIDLVVQGHKYIVCPCGEVFENGQAVGGHKGACKTPRLRDRDERTVAAFLNEHYPGYKQHLAFAKETQKLVAKCKKRWPKIRGVGRSRRKPKAATASATTTTTTPSATAAARRAAKRAHGTGSSAAATSTTSGTTAASSAAALHARKAARSKPSSRLPQVPRQDFIDAVQALTEKPGDFWRYFRLGKNEPQPQPETIVLAGFQLHEASKAVPVKDATLRAIYEGRFGMAPERRHNSRYVHYRPHSVAGFDKAQRKGHA